MINSTGDSAYTPTAARNVMERKATPRHSLAEGAAARRLEASGERDDSETTRVRWEFLAEASRCLADSLEFETTLETVAELALPARLLVHRRSH